MVRHEWQRYGYSSDNQTMWDVGSNAVQTSARRRLMGVADH